MKPILTLPDKVAHDALIKLMQAVKRDLENYTCGPAAKQALAEYEALKR